MYWMFTGYLASFYLLVAGGTVFTLHEHSRPLFGLVAGFVIIPSIIAALSAESVLLAPDDWKTVLRCAFRSGTMTRARAFSYGFVTGLGVLLCATAVYFLHELAYSGRVASLKPHQGKFFGISAIVLMFLVALAPIIPGYCLVKSVKQSQGKPS